MAKTKPAEDEAPSSTGGGKEAAVDEGKPAGGAPLFPGASDDWVSVQVERLEPVEEEGFLGRLPITATETEIRGRFGGGRYIVKAINGKNQIKANRTLSIAGDPVFVSEVSEERWRRGLGHRGTRTGPVAAAMAGAASPASASTSLGAAELLTFFQVMQQAQAAQQQQWMQMQAEERRAQDERRRADDDRRRAEEKEREDRRSREEELARQRDREFMKTTIELVTSKPASGETGQMQAFITGLTTALKLRPAAGGGGGDGDEAEDGEESADPIAETIRGAVRGLVDGIAGRQAQGTPSPVGTPGAAAGASEDVTVTGPLGVKLKTFATKAQASGKDPNALLASALDVMEKKLGGTPITVPHQTVVAATLPRANGASTVAAAVAAVQAKNEAQAQAARD